MKTRLILAIGLATALTLLVLAALTGRPTRAAPSAACHRYVVTGGNDSSTNDCSNPNDPCKTVQYALGRAATGNVICVADRTGSGYDGPSTYLGTIVITKSVTLDGAWQAAYAVRGGVWLFTPIPCNPANVILDGEGTRRVISITGAIAPTIQCFTITGGDANGSGGDPDGYDAGGGIYSKDAAPVIVSNVITRNFGCAACTYTYGRGGGIYLLNAPATAVISGNVIDSNAGANTILGWGGGIALRNSSAQVLSNTVQRNVGGTAGDGGGIYVLDGSPTIADNHILTNTAAGGGVLGNGGGIYVASSTPVTIERNLVQLNTALRGTGFITMPNRGGGIYYDGPAVVIRDNTLRSNAATIDQSGLGGGLYLRNLSASAAVSGNTVVDNRASYGIYGEGGGIHLDACQATVTGNHVFQNIASSSETGWGGGVYVNGGAGLVQGNTITGNLALLGAVTGYGWGGGIAISNSLVVVQDNWIVQNASASAPNSTGAGGGVIVYMGAPRIAGNHILSNSTSSQGSGIGGGLYAEAARIWLDGNTVLDNRAAGSTYSRGGGVRLSACPAFTLTNNIVARNAVSTTGSGVAIAASTGRMDYNTIADNRTGDGVGVYVQSSSQVTLTHNIIANQTVGISRTSDTVVTAQSTLFDGNGSKYNAGVGSANEVSGPAALRADYHLKNWSAAIDRATPLAWVTADVDGDVRPFGAQPDVGADEASCNRYVLSPDGSDGGRDCSDEAHPCRTVQYALSQAADGDAICVADHSLQPGPSVYLGTHTVSKSVTLDGAWQAACVDPSDLRCAFTAAPCNPANVVLNAQGAGRVVTVSVPSGRITSTVRCLTIAGGRTTTGNSGAGLYSENATLVVAQTVITNNASAEYGGGVYIESGSAVITASDILSNSTDHGGGGIYLALNATALLHGNRIADNYAQYGGGIATDRAIFTATANLLVHNQASEAWMMSGEVGRRVVATNNVVANNDGVGVSIYSYQADLIHNTIVSNTDSAVTGSYTATLMLTNNLIAYNGAASVVTSTGSAASISYNLFWHNSSDPYPGTHAVLADPLLAADGYHLLPGSPAINTGVPTWVETDVDGESRLGVPDLGVDEYVVRIYLPLVVRNL